MKERLYRKIGRNNHYYQNMKGKKELEKYIEINLEEIEDLIKNYFPSGSGIDCGCTYDEENSKKDKVIINFAFHFMNENGFYTHWKNYKLYLTADDTFCNDFKIAIIGENYQDIKSYLYDLFYDVLSQEIE